MKKYITDICKEALISHLNILIPFLVRLLGVEPRTSWSVAKRSIQLSYRRIFNFYLIIVYQFLVYFNYKINLKFYG